jgi:hypothetical protein
MKSISTRTHGILDYIVGLFLIAAPWLLNFNRGGGETWVPVVLGIMTIIYSLITDYEMGIARILPMRMHLLLDVMAGIFLALSPWIFNFDDFVYVPHLIIGILELLVVSMTSTSVNVMRTATGSTESNTGRNTGGREVAH